MRLVLDTCVMVSAFRSPAGASAEILRLTLNGTLEIAATTAIFLEYEDVLQRPITAPRSRQINSGSRSAAHVPQQ